MMEPSASHMVRPSDETRSRRQRGPRAGVFTSGESHGPSRRHVQAGLPRRTRSSCRPAWPSSSTRRRRKWGTHHEGRHVVAVPVPGRAADDGDLPVDRRCAAAGRVHGAADGRRRRRAAGGQPRRGRARAARAANLWGLLVGDNHAIPAQYANMFQPVPTIARLSAETGPMMVGMVLLAPFYHPLLLAEQIGTLSAFVDAPIVVTFASGGSAHAFEAFGYRLASRGTRSEEMIPVVRALLAGEAVTATGRSFELVGATISPLPRHPTEIWIAGTNDITVERAGRLGDGWLTAQNATDAHARRAARAVPADGGRARPSMSRGAAPRCARCRHRRRGARPRRSDPGAGLPRCRLRPPAGRIARDGRGSAPPLRVDGVRARHGPPHHGRPLTR